MNNNLTSTAHVAHNLGLATAFGGTLFGKLAMDPALKVVSNPAERGQLMSAAWATYNLVNAAGLAIAAGTWFAGRRLVSGRAVGKNAQPLVVAKDILMATVAITGITSMVMGVMFAKQAPDAKVPVADGIRPSEETPPKAAKLQTMSGTLGVIYGLAAAGVIGLTAVLDFKSGLSHKWAFAARNLP